jgi:hypothetical protein
MPRDVSPLPWTAYLVSAGLADPGGAWALWGWQDSNENQVSTGFGQWQNETVTESQARANTALVRDAVNLVGKDIDRPGFADIVRAIGGMGEHELEMLTDFLKEKGWTG